MSSQLFHQYGQVTKENLEAFAYLGSIGYDYREWLSSVKEDFIRSNRGNNDPHLVEFDTKIDGHR